MLNVDLVIGIVNLFGSRSKTVRHILFHSRLVERCYSSVRFCSIALGTDVKNKNVV